MCCAFSLEAACLLHENISSGYSFEVPHRGASNEYPQHMFSWRIRRKIMILISLLSKMLCKLRYFHKIYTVSTKICADEKTLEAACLLHENISSGYSKEKQTKKTNKQKKKKTTTTTKKATTRKQAKKKKKKKKKKQQQTPPPPPHEKKTTTTTKKNPNK